MSDAHVQYDDFPHLKIDLEDDQLWAMSHPNATVPGLFYSDGELPWNSRAKAEAYLGRLKIAQALM